MSQVKGSLCYRDGEPVARGADGPRQELADNRRSAAGSEKPFRHAIVVAPSIADDLRVDVCCPVLQRGSPTPVGYTLRYPGAIVGAGDPIRAAAKIEALTPAGVVAARYLREVARGRCGQAQAGARQPAPGRSGRPPLKRDDLGVCKKSLRERDKDDLDDLNGLLSRFPRILTGPRWRVPCWGSCPSSAHPVAVEKWSSLVVQVVHPHVKAHSWRFFRRL
jgi:hypothetical protein